MDLTNAPLRGHFDNAGRHLMTRALDVNLPARIESYRAEHDLSQTEGPAGVRAANKSVVAEWESAVSVPSGLRMRELIDLELGEWLVELA